jgi:hypothetical protein
MTQDPDQIRADIERTRAELSADVDTLNEKVNPKYVAQRKTEQVKDRARGVKEKVMGAVPTPSSSSGSSSSGSLKDKVMGVMPSGGSSSGGPSVVDTGKDKASSAMSSVSGAASNVSGAASSAPGQVVSQAQGNPLAAGLIAFGVGWLASSLLPASDAEQRAAVQLKERATDLAAPLQEKAKAAAQEVAENLREPAQQAAQTVQSSAQDAVGTVKSEAQSAKDDVAGQAQSAKQSVQGQASGSSSSGYSGGATTPPSSSV